MIHPRNNDTNIYPLFEKLFPCFTQESTVLDFGGSSGNLLYDSNNKILQENYICIDVVKDAILSGKKEFPNSKFIHYNKYNQMYNPDGNINADFPTIYSKIDYIWAYSVFSHTNINDFIKTIKWMKSLKPKKIITSYLSNDKDQESQRVLDWYFAKRQSEYGECVDFRKNNDDYFYLSDNNKYGDFTGRHFIAVYNTQWLIKQLSDNGVIANKIILKDTSIPFLEIV